MARRLRLGVAGLGRAFTLMLPAFAADERVELAAAADPRAEARARFAADFGARVYASVEELCADAAVEAVYVATPHEHHAAHAIAAARAGKHVLVEKPMALSPAQARGMIDAAARAGVSLVVGHSHSFDAPIARAREIVAGGGLGRVRMITALNFTDFLYRPRRPEELDTDRGGGVMFSQAAHQVDIVRLLAAGRCKSVRALAGDWDPERRTEGAYAALLTFEDGVFATLTYSGYGHFDSDELTGWIGELGRAKDPNAPRTVRHRSPYGSPDYAPPAADAPWHEHFGFVVVSCERGDVRPLPDRVVVYGNAEPRVEPLAKPPVPRVEVIDELYAAAVLGRAPLHDGAWGLATLEVCVAMLASARGGGEVIIPS